MVCSKSFLIKCRLERLGIELTHLLKETVRPVVRADCFSVPPLVVNTTWLHGGVSSKLSLPFPTRLLSVKFSLTINMVVRSKPYIFALGHISSSKSS